MTSRTNSYLSPKLESRSLPEKGFFGVFACQPVVAGELLVMWAGLLADGAAFAELPELLQSRSIQVEDDLYLVPSETEEADYVNHSCTPNAGIEGQTAIVALRDIAPGEEICYDYAMSDGSDYDEFECHCGAPDCRGKITGEDWRLPELQARYGEHFSPYILRRIRRSQAGA